MVVTTALEAAQALAEALEMTFGEFIVKIVDGEVTVMHEKTTMKAQDLSDIQLRVEPDASG